MEYYNEDAFIFNDCISSDGFSSFGNYSGSDSDWFNRCGVLSNDRPLGCQGADFGFANDIPLGGEEFISRISLARLSLYN